MAVDAAGNVYIADDRNHRIRKVDAAGTISTFAGTSTYGFNGDGSAATSTHFRLAYSSGVAVDASGNVYIADTFNHRIRRVSATGTVWTIAGSGTAGFSGDSGQATSAQLNEPRGLALDAAGNVYIADRANHRIRKVDATAGTISTIAGSGTAGATGDGGLATSARLNNPEWVAVDGAGNIYISDVGNRRLRKVDAATGVISRIRGVAGAFSGDGGPATSAQLSTPLGVAADGAGNIYIADTLNHRVRRVSATGTISTFAGTGTAGYSGDKRRNAGLRKH